MKSGDSSFPTTHWTLVEAVREGPSEEAAKAMEVLCQTYWYPIYAYLRRSGRGQHDAEDLTQSFFARLISEKVIHDARQHRGRLRTFLLTVLVRHLSDHGRHHSAQKRGGGQPLISFDETQAETRYRREPLDLRDPEKIYLNAWAGELVQQVRAQLRNAFEREGRLEIFEELCEFISGDEFHPPYKEVAARLGSTPGAVRLLVHRLRKKFHTLLEKEVERTVTHPNELKEEMAWLRQTLAER